MTQPHPNRTLERCLWFMLGVAAVQSVVIGVLVGLLMAP